MAFVRHAVRFRMSMLLHDLKKYELTQAVYPLFAEAGIPYHVFALFDYERCGAHKSDRPHVHRRRAVA